MSRSILRHHDAGMQKVLIYVLMLLPGWHFQETPCTVSDVANTELFQLVISFDFQKCILYLNKMSLVITRAT